MNHGDLIHVHILNSFNAHLLTGTAGIFADRFNRTVEEALAVVLRELACDNRYLIAVVGGEVVGFVCWRVEGEVHHGIAELWRIAVKRRGRPRDVSDRLVRAMEDDASKWYIRNGGRVRKVWIKTRSNNRTAHALYKRNGYEQESVLPNHFGDGKHESSFARYFPREGQP